MQPEARAQLRQARQSAGLSLRELGVRVGLSASLLSQIERGKSEPSVSSLYALVKELGISLDAVLGSSTPVAEPEKRRESSQTTQARPTHSPAIRPTERAHIEMTSGVHWEQLTRGFDPYADALLVTYAPGGKSSSDGTLMTHSGVEYAYLLEGELTLHIGFQRVVVRTGDSLRFESSQPHMYENKSREPARGVWFILGRGNGNQGLTNFTEHAGTELPSSAIDVLRAFGQPLSISDSGVA